MLWERRRLATWGIISYELHEVSGKIVFPASGALFQCVDGSYNQVQLFPMKLRVMGGGAKLSPQICPSNPDLVAYICNHDIWVTHTASGCAVRLTYAHKGGRSLSDDPLCAGVPSYVMQEEFSRYQGKRIIDVKLHRVTIRKCQRMKICVNFMSWNNQQQVYIDIFHVYLHCVHVCFKDIGGNRTIPTVCIASYTKKSTTAT